MATRAFDGLVVGAGVVGTAAAYHLARRGARVALVERAAIGHAGGSSHGASRIIRHSYADLDSARMMAAAFEAWRALEVDAGEAVYFRTGGVSLCRPLLDYARQVAGSLAALGIGHRRLSGRDLRRIAPAFSVPDDEDVVFEPEIGILAADRIVRLQAELARRHGGDRVLILEETGVDRLDLDGDRPAVIAGGRRLEADRLIVAAGAWTARLLPDLAVPLTVTRQFVAYLRPEPAALYTIGRLPVFIRKLEPEHEAFYGLPDFAGCGPKVALHHAGPVVDPDRVDRTVSPADEARLRRCLAETLPDLAGAPAARFETCLYTSTADERFVVGPLPGRPEVLVASACSGHGFKFGNLVGRVLADLALDGGTDLATDGWLVPPGGPLGADAASESTTPHGR